MRGNVMSHVVVLDRVSKRYRDQVALDNVTLRVPAGVVFALLGENGAGKTTAIRLMLGLADADAGRVQVLGFDSRRDGLAVRQRVGYMPERPTLYEWMTAAEIGWFTAGFYAEGFEHRYLSLIENFRVPLKRKISQMSKGMRAKVALSLALAHEPELLILDEPTSGLDTIVRHEFLESMVDVAAAGRTVILSSHQIGEVERVADIVAIIRQGRVMTCEPLDELKRTTKEITITVEASRAAAPLVPGEVLAKRQRGHQWQYIVRNPSLEATAALEAGEGIVAADSRTPSLEEIFVAYMQCDLDAISSTYTPMASEVEA
jgi:ABC-2 type transport system ATP-binding protein